MIKKEWTIQLEDGEHNIKLEQDFLSTSRKVRLDGQLLEKDINSTQSFFGNNEFDFEIGEHPIKISMRDSGLIIRYDLFVDGKSISTGKPYAPLAPLPPWVWLFIIANGAIPALTIGGAIPAVIGIGGAAICISQSRNTARSVRNRVLVCVGVTLLAWVLFLAFATGLAYFQQ